MKNVVEQIDAPPLQVLDCADGQCARRYGLGSEFGAWLDHTTDEWFGYCFAVAVISLIAVEHGPASVPVAAIVAVLAVMGVGGKSTFDVKHSRIPWQDFKWNHKLGMYQELYMTYIYCVLMGGFYAAGWLP